VVAAAVSALVAVVVPTLPVPGRISDHSTTAAFRSRHIRRVMRPVAP
jgi:hypothetical protein